MILNAFPQYQTSFRIRSKEEKAPAFSSVQNQIFGWVLEKEKDRLVRNDKKSFFMRCDWKNLFDTRSSIATNTFICDEYRAWALRYAEQDKDPGSRRYWYTDICLKEIGDEVIFYARVSYAKCQHDLSATSEAPGSSVPRFIRYLLAGPYKLYSGNPAFGLFDRPVPVATVGSGKFIADLIQSRSRRYPLVIVNGGSEDLLKEAQFLAYKLAGKAQVILLGDNPDLAAEFRHYMPRDLWVGYGKLRVYFRISGLNLNPQRHRFYDIADPEYALQREGIINGLLRNHTLEEDGCIQNISEVGRLLTLSKLNRFRAENPEREAEVNELYKLVEEIETERDDFKQQADYYASEHDARAAELHAERAKQRHFEQGRQLASAHEAKLEFLNRFSRLPSSLEEVVQCFASMCSDRLIVTESALKEAAAYEEFTELSLAWEMFFHLAHTLHTMKFSSSETMDLEKVIKERTGFELAMSEGRNTKRDAKLMKLRQISCAGREYDITPHLKSGNKPPKMLRIHFAFDVDLQKIIVGYIGPHMENATSRTRK